MQNISSEASPGARPRVLTPGILGEQTILSTLATSSGTRQWVWVDTGEEGCAALGESEKREKSLSENTQASLAHGEVKC